MNVCAIEKAFARMGARLEVQPAADRVGFWSRREEVEPLDRVVLDIGQDRLGERFTLRLPETVEVQVLNLDAADRHLVLMAKDGPAKRKFLCGHDERHWFVAAVPEKASVGTVAQAKQALKPVPVQIREARLAVPGAKRHRRKNAAFRRQGEWFFVPAPQVKVPANELLRNEPLSRGRGKAHWMEFCWRTGGEEVWVCRKRPTGVSPAAHRRLLADEPQAKSWGWRLMRRDPLVFVRGRIRHPDHATITLPGWHQVFMNTESQAAAMRSVAFLD